MTNPWDIINAPVHYVRAPRRFMSLRMALILAGIATAIGAMIGLLQIYEVMK